MKPYYIAFLLFIPLLASSQGYNIFVSDAGNYDQPPWQILKYEENGENPVTFIDNNLSWPQDILFLEGTGRVLISNLSSGRIAIHDDETGAFIDDFASNIGGPTRMKIGPDGLLYVLQWSGNGKVKRYQLDGTPLGDFTSVGVPQSIGMDWDENANLYVSSYSADHVRKFDLDGIDQGLFVNSNLLGPTNIWFDQNGDLLISDYNGTAVKRFDNSGQYLGDFLSGLGQSEGIAYLPNGEIIIGNGVTHSVKRFSEEGVYIDDIIAEGSGGLLTPNAVVIQADKTTSLDEVAVSEKQIVFPSLGNQFRIDSIFAPKIEKVEIYNLAGFFVDKFDGLKWSATQFAEGAYIVNILFFDGTAHSQRIVVNN